jgi:hypothetical protein
MKQVLIIGMNPHTIDFTKPGFLPELTAEKVLLGLKVERKNLKEAGCNSDMSLIDTGDFELSPLANQLRTKQFDGVMAGARVRLPPSE